MTSFLPLLVAAAAAAFTVSAQVAQPPVLQASELSACLGQLRGEALARGIPGEKYDEIFASMEPDPSILVLMDKQPEFVTPIWDYLGALVDEKRIAQGRLKLAAFSDALDRIEETYGVDRQVLVALWGVETRYGEIMGSRPLLRSLATGACFGRRQPFFRQELLATLRIVHSGDIAPERLVGSWAGAFGQTQFMPSTFHRVAVDFDGDGRKDILDSVPDALASTANYLKQSGWKKGEPWGYEVRVPRKYDGPSGRRARLPMERWRELGIKRIDGRALPGDENAALLMPAGSRGPAFIVTSNFQALIAYNPAEAYALAIAHLSDRLKGGGAIQASWPVGETMLTREQRIALQERLAARGYDVGTPDGIIGPRTVEAIKEFQKSIGLQPDGFATVALLKKM
ncbi:MAG TPA: lytic murein transglycosylase [Usitatibacter sp.]|nr:lytic murein transglycosylase [Usitatibacter sp.]